MKVRLVSLLLAFFAAGSLFADGPRIAVLDLIAKAGFIKAETDQITDILRSDIVKTAAFTMLERSYVDQILTEQAFSLSAAVEDSGYAAQVGKLVAADYIIAGTVGRLLGKISLNVRMINVSSGKVVAAESIQSTDSTLFEDIGLLVLRIAKTIPSGSSKTQPETERSSPSAQKLYIDAAAGGLFGENQSGLEFQLGLKYQFIESISAGAAVLFGIPLDTSDSNLSDSLKIGIDIFGIFKINKFFGLGLGFRGLPEYLNNFGGPELILQFGDANIRLGVQVFESSGFCILAGWSF